MEHSKGLPHKRYQLPTVMHNGSGVSAIESNRVLNSMISSVAWSKITSTPTTLFELLIMLTYLLLCGCTKSTSHFNQSISNDTISTPVSNIKNIQRVGTGTGYEAFGSLLNVRVNMDVQFVRIGVNHLTGGNPYYRLYNEATNHWYDPVLMSKTTTKDCSVYATKMDNDSIVVFTGESNNGKGGDWSIDINFRSVTQI